MRLFRIAAVKFGLDLSGAGARLFGGRWTPKGVPAVYASESAPLAALEVLVHAPADIAPTDLALVEIDIPDDLEVETVELSRLDKDWDALPYRGSTMRIGEGWARARVTVALKVPSAIVPYGRGWNFILNPLHVGFSRVRLVGAEPFSFDGRLTRR